MKKALLVALLAVVAAPALVAVAAVALLVARAGGAFAVRASRRRTNPP
jgi:hypothetical protein